MSSTSPALPLLAMGCLDLSSVTGPVFISQNRVVTQASLSTAAQIPGLIGKSRNASSAHDPFAFFRPAGVGAM